jgi:Holliday junction DNA helicase RuvB
VISQAVAEEALALQGVDDVGLDELDRAFLEALIKIYEGGPAGIEALAATMGQERDTLEDVVEPYLMQIGFIVRTRQGRQATRAAFEHMGCQPPETPPNADEDATLF